MNLTKVRPLVPVLVEFSDESGPASLLTLVDYGKNKVYGMDGQPLSDDFFSRAILGKLDTPIPVTILPQEVQEELAKRKSRLTDQELSSFQEA